MEWNIFIDVEHSLWTIHGFQCIKFESLKKDLLFYFHSVYLHQSVKGDLVHQQGLWPGLKASFLERKASVCPRSHSQHHAPLEALQKYCLCFLEARRPQNTSHFTERRTGFQNILPSESCFKVELRFGINV